MITFQRRRWFLFSVAATWDWEGGGRWRHPGRMAIEIRCVSYSQEIYEQEEEEEEEEEEGKEWESGTESSSSSCQFKRNKRGESVISPLAGMGLLASDGSLNSNSKCSVSNWMHVGNVYQCSCRFSRQSFPAAIISASAHRWFFPSDQIWWRQIKSATK